tara:strand:+ start:1239 stop:2354 length:1116 start_codon:yes stop_codon:yes gene_type:complete
MKNLLSTFAIFSILSIFPEVVKSDQMDFWGINERYITVIEQVGNDGDANYSPGVSSSVADIYKFNSVTGNSNLINSFQACTREQALIDSNRCGRLLFKEHNAIEGKIHFKHSTSKTKVTYDVNLDSWSESSSKYSFPPDDYTTEFKISSIQYNADGTIVIGNNERKLIENKADGSIHIGENSWITKEEGGRQKVYAKDSAGNPIPIDYTNGTKLLINGRDVEQSINNVGALSAALTGLPTVPNDTTLACGLGTGTHGGDLAFSGGCASKVNDKLSINYAASMTMPGQDYAGDFEDTFSARAGFIWKLGKSTKPSQISMKEKDELKKEISDLKANNKNIISQNKALLTQLERLEKIALSAIKSKDSASIKLP